MKVNLTADSICRTSPSTVACWMTTASIIISSAKAWLFNKYHVKAIQIFRKQWISLLGREFISVFQSKFRTHPILLGNKIQIKRRENVKSQEKISIEAATSALSFTGVTYERLSNMPSNDPGTRNIEISYSHVFYKYLKI